MRPSQSSHFSSSDNGQQNINASTSQQQHYLALQQQHQLRQQQLQQNMYQQQHAQQQHPNSSGYASPAPLSVGSHNAGTPTHSQLQQSQTNPQQYNAQQQQIIRMQQQQAASSASAQKSQQQPKRETDTIEHQQQLLQQIKHESEEEDLELLKLPQRSPQKGDSPASPSKIPELQQQNITNSIESVMEKLFGNVKESTTNSRPGKFFYN